jgi:hypothetical protein
MCVQIARLAASSNGGMRRCFGWGGGIPRLRGVHALVMGARLNRGMVDGVGGATEAAALAAREKLATIAGGDSRDEHGAGRVARVALFDEALLAALRARFAELRMVTK